MVIVLIFFGIIAGTVTGLAFLITGYGIGAIALAYWAAGSSIIVLTVLSRVLFNQFSSKSSHSHFRTKFPRRTHSTRL